jgi:hypothetical protein
VLKSFCIAIGLIRRPKISLLIPFSSTDKIREKHFKWLLKYWKHELPHAEIIIGHSRSKVFCKGEALNNALSRSHGKILAVVDADAYMRGRIIERCANNILDFRENGHHLWYVPYRHLYRLTKFATDIVIRSNPKEPYRVPDPPPDCWIENQGDVSRYGSRYGAMITIFPREALKYIKNFDERFKGWGGEDIALLRALDTLYGKHKTTRNAVFHLWHPFIGHDYKTRVWDSQQKPNSNSELATKYNNANRDKKKMRQIIEESHAYFKRQGWK